MLMVKTKLKPSPIHGIGLFADQFIPRGTIIWEFNELIDLVFNRKQMEQLAENARQQIEKYSYRDLRSGRYILCGDDARFFNHSEHPNCIDTYQGPNGGMTVALCDISGEEELTCDYALFDLDFVEGKYRIPPVSKDLNLSYSAGTLDGKTP